MQQLEQLVTSLDYQWQRWIVRFGSEHQRLQLADFKLIDLMPKVYGMLVAGGLVMLVMLRWILPEPKSEAAEVKLYRRFCRKMAKAGIRIQSGEGAMDFAIRAKQEKPRGG